MVGHSHLQHFFFLFFFLRSPLHLSYKKTSTITSCHHPSLVRHHHLLPSLFTPPLLYVSHHGHTTPHPDTPIVCFLYATATTAWCLQPPTKTASFQFLIMELWITNTKIHVNSQYPLLLSSVSPSQAMKKLVVLVALVVMILGFEGVESRRNGRLLEENIEYSAMSCRAHVASLTDFGGVGDGVTSNTDAFKTAIEHLGQLASEGGSQLFVPPGKWLTGSFNLTSHFTLFLHKDAVLLASQEESEWPVIEPLPSYGRGRDAAGGRYISLIFGTNLTDVIVTGDNATIDGQGAVWWQKFKKGKLKYTRPYLIEIMYSDKVQISNLTFLNSPSWNVHPVYSSNVIIKGVTILAPIVPISPNTDGINPDSCTNVLIEDCYIVSGDDCVAIKSGWDEYGISFAMPTKHLIIRRLTCISPDSAVIALGSEMSGGIQDVRAEDILAINSQSGIRIKTGIGRGGYVKDIFVRRMTMHTMKWAFWMTGNYGSHPDKHYDPKALPVIQGISYTDMVAENVTMAAWLEGIDGNPFTGICISNVTMGMARKAKKVPWTCTDISGVAVGVSPKPCSSLPEQDTSCPFPSDSLPIESVEQKLCSFRANYM